MLTAPILQPRYKMCLHAVVEASLKQFEDSSVEELALPDRLGMVPELHWT